MNPLLPQINLIPYLKFIGKGVSVLNKHLKAEFHPQKI